MYPTNNIPSHEGPMYPMGNYQVGFNPSGLDPYGQQAAQYTQHVVNGLLHEIQSKAQQNPLRMFAFNQMAANGFNNNEFFKLVNETMCYLSFMGRKTSMLPEQAIAKACQDMVYWLTAANTVNFNHLQNFAPMQQIHQALQEYQNMIGQMNQDRQFFNNPQNNMNQGIVGQYGNGGGFNSFSNMNTNTRNSGIFANSQMPGNQQLASSTGRDYGGVANAPTQQPEQTFQPTPQPEVSIKKEVSHDQWKPTEDNPYRTTFSPSVQTATVEIVDGHKTVFKVEENMDENRHKLSNLFGQLNSVAANNIKPSQAHIALEKQIYNLEEHDSMIDNADSSISDEFSVEVGFENAWINGSIQRFNEFGNDDKNPIYQWSSFIVNPMLYKNASMCECLCDLSEANDAMEVIRILNTSVNRLGIGFLNIIDDRLAKAVNSVITNNLCIPKLKIDSFIDDWAPLVNHIASKHGDVIAAILVGNQKKILKSVLNIASGDLAKTISDNFYQTEKELPIVYFQQEVSFTLLDFAACELDIDFIPDTAALISKINNRPWYVLAERIFSRFGDSCQRHLIRTSDRHVLEITRGWIAGEPYLISLLK